MFDCGMHMGYNDERRFPDFSYISKTNNFDQILDAVIITHFHLDHCGALPYFTEMCGYNGPIYMSYPTKAICPILLEDYRKITVERKGETNFFTSQMIKNCMKKVVAVNLHETVHVDDELEIRAYYAGHVLGACMFYIKVGEQSVVYTGDYNMTPDRHLGPASIDKLRPDLFITETTYATMIRDSKRCRERDLLKRIHKCVDNGGKVLIPVFALGRAQELCILLDTYWEQMNLNVPIYFSAGLTEKANYYYKLFINWTNQKIKETFVRRNMFDFKHIAPFERQLADEPGAQVLFATPGMLHAGTSLEVFKKWAGSERNMVIMPGYCVVGTVGNKLLAGKKRKNYTVEIDKKTTLEVKCKVKHLSFSAHADAKGIMQIIRQVEPKNVLLVHGEKGKMQYLLKKIETDLGIPCYAPANGVSVNIDATHSVPVSVSRNLLKRQLASFVVQDSLAKKQKLTVMNNLPVQGLLVTNNQNLRLMEPHDAMKEFGLVEHTLTFESQQQLSPKSEEVSSALKPLDVVEKLFTDLSRWLAPIDVRKTDTDNTIAARSLSVNVSPENVLGISWSYKDEDLAATARSIIGDSLLSQGISAIDIASK